MERLDLGQGGQLKLPTLWVVECAVYGAQVLWMLVGVTCVVWCGVLKASLPLEENWKVRPMMGIHHFPLRFSHGGLLLVTLAIEFVQFVPHNIRHCSPIDAGPF